MDFLRRAGRGQLAAMLGPVALSQDESIRTLFTAQAPTAAGSYRIEDVLAENLPANMTALLRSYANGVNRFLQDLQTGANGATTPVEYIALAVSNPSNPYTPTPWTIQDTLAVGRLQQFELSETIEEELAYGELAEAFLTACGATPPDECLYAGLFADLTRFAPARDTFIIPDASVPAARPASPATKGVGDALARALALVSARPHVLGRRGQVGSNNWVLNGTMVAGGSGTLVANDPHLSLTNPSIWYTVEISSPTRNVGGFTFPGIPFILIGHNDYIAWGDTVAEYDVSDVYTFPLGAGGLPVTSPGVTPLVVPGGTIDVLGGTPVNFPVLLIPQYGPVIAAATTASPFIAARWTGQEPSDDFLAFFDLNAATSVYAAVTALQNFEVGAQNFVIGDVAGNIAYDPHAYVPIRKAGCFLESVPWAPMPGDGTCVWTGRISDADLPQIVNPPAHRIVTANNDITGYTAADQPIQSNGAYLYATADLGYRATEIEARLAEQSGGYALDDMTSVQADITSLFASDLVPGLLAWYAQSATQVTAQGLDGAVALLKAWKAQSPPYQTPTGLATSDPGGAATADADTLTAANASTLFHALVPRLASQILDPVLAAVSLGGAPLTSQEVVDMLGDQEMAKYLVALSAYAQGNTPTVPLATGAASVCGTSCAPQAVAALAETVSFLSSATVFGSATTSDWIWGRQHTVTFDSELASGGVNLFNYGPFARRGGQYTVDVADFTWSDSSTANFRVGAGPSVRFSAQMAPGNVQWRAVVPGGQRDYPGTPNYEDQVPSWLANEPGNLPWGEAQIEAATQRSIVFTP
jgi:penicillin amidase